jgi:tetratricopeptide (TPR) repeat protein
MAVHKLIMLAVIAAAAFNGATNGAHSTYAASSSSADVPKSWAPADSADSLWRQGRNAISDEDWRLAQRLFSRIHDNFPKSAYAADSYYWEAFALSRRGGTDNTKDAVSLLEKQIARYANASSVKNGDSKSLLTRLQGTLARNGDAGATADILARAGRVWRFRRVRRVRRVGRLEESRVARFEQLDGGVQERGRRRSSRGAERTSSDGFRRRTADPQESARAPRRVLGSAAPKGGVPRVAEARR